MRCLYLDPGLHSDQGHHRQWCRLVADALSDSGIDTVVYGLAAAEPALVEALGMIPLFRVNAYLEREADPICGWLTGFERAAEATLADLLQIPVEGDDLVLVASGWAAQLMAVVRWLAALPPDRRPTVLMDIARQPGFDLKNENGKLVGALPDPRVEPKPYLYRHVGLEMQRLGVDRIHVATGDPFASQLYEALLGRRIGTLPFPYQAKAPPQSRVGRRPVVLSVLGHQFPYKGYHLMPQLARRLLAARRDVEILAHNCQPGQLPAAQHAMRRIAAADERLRLDERTVDAEGWEALIQASDLILCPYEARHYALMGSGVAAEAIANGIPVVVPDETALSRWLERFGRGGAVFGQFDDSAVFAAVESVLDRYDEMAGAALAGARQWAAEQGPRHYVDALLRLPHA